MTIGQRLKQERLTTGLSQPKFAAIAGTTKKSQLDYETDKTQPRAGYFAAIHDAAIGVDILYILTGKRGHLSAIEQELNTLSSSEKDALSLLIRRLASAAKNDS